MKLRINITKDILERSMWCGTEKRKGFISENCPVALALREISIYAAVKMNDVLIIMPDTKPFNVRLPSKIRKFTARFDALADDPEKRLLLAGRSFDIKFPDELIDHINIDDLNKSKVLELVQDNPETNDIKMHYELLY